LFRKLMGMKLVARGEATVGESFLRLLSPPEGLPVNMPGPVSARPSPNSHSAKSSTSPQPLLSPKFQHNRAALELSRGPGPWFPWSRSFQEERDMEE